MQLDLPKRLNAVIRFYHGLVESLSNTTHLDSHQQWAYDELTVAMKRISQTSHAEVNDLKLHEAVRRVHELAGLPPQLLPVFEVERRPAGWTIQRAAKVRDKMREQREKRRAKQAAMSSQN